MKLIKKLLIITLTICLVLQLGACGKEVTPDYDNAASFEAELNSGANLEGKVVRFKAGEVHPESALGYDVWAGEHLNFISDKSQDIKEGDEVTVKVTSISNVLGSWIIRYEKISSSSNGETSKDDKKEAEDTSALTPSPVVEVNNSGKNITKEETELTIEKINIDAIGFKNSFGEPKLSAYVAFKNTSDVPITFSNLRIDFEDDNGKLIGTDSFAKCIPEAVKPGQIGYIYSYYYDINGINLDNGISMKPDGTIIEANNFYEIDVSDVSAKSGSLLDITVIGRGTNNSGSNQPLAEPGAIFFDENNNVVGFCYGMESFSNGETTSFEISGDMMSPDMDPSIVDHVEVYIQGNGW